MNLKSRLARLEQQMPWPLEPHTLWVLRFSTQDPHPDPEQTDWIIESYLYNHRWPERKVTIDCRGWYPAWVKEKAEEREEQEAEDEEEDLWTLVDSYSALF